MFCLFTPLAMGLKHIPRAELLLIFEFNPESQVSIQFGEESGFNQYIISNKDVYLLKSYVRPFSVYEIRVFRQTFNT